MKFHGIDMQGKFLVEEEAAPSWVAADDRRLVRNSVDDRLYIGLSTSFSEIVQNMNYDLIGWPNNFKAGLDDAFHPLEDQSLSTSNEPTFSGLFSSKAAGSNASTMLTGGGNATMTGDQNVLIGEFAGIDITTGENNLFVGYTAGFESAGGSNNTYIGQASGLYNFNGSHNFVAGFAAGRGVTSNSYSNNIFIGFNSGYATTTGGDNVALGQHSGDSITTGSYNILLGGYTGANLTTGSNNICIGQGTVTSSASATYQCIIGTAGNPVSVGIGGNSNPQYTLDATGDINCTGTFRINTVDILTTIASSVPVGAVMAFAMTAVPSGWLKCNGASYYGLSGTYSDLFDLINYTYGNAGGGNFKVPDLRGEFIRGWADNRAGIPDSGRSMNDPQTDAFKEHKHLIPWGEHWSSATYAPWGVSGSQNQKGSGDTDTDNYRYYSEPVGNTETRPRNIAMQYCIKY